VLQPYYIPGHIITFVHLTADQLVYFDNLDYAMATEPGMYVMIESLENELPPPSPHSHIVVGASKQLTVEEQ
jgi:hypothetical protein